MSVDSKILSLEAQLERAREQLVKVERQLGQERRQHQALEATLRSEVTRLVCALVTSEKARAELNTECSAAYDQRDAANALLRETPTRAQFAAVLAALRKIDAVTVDSAHFTHSGMQHAAVEHIDDALESVRDLIGLAPQPPAQPVPVDTRSDEERARAAALSDVRTWDDLKGKKL